MKTVEAIDTASRLANIFCTSVRMQVHGPIGVEGLQVVSGSD